MNQSVISAEVVRHVDQLKVLHAGLNGTLKHARVYTYLVGLKLEVVKSLSTNGNADSENSFAKLWREQFPEIAQRTGYRSRNFYKAVTAATEKVATVATFPTAGNLDTLLLPAGDLPDNKKAEVADQIEKLTKGAGVEATIREWRKKSAPRYKRTPEEKVEDEKRQADEFAKMVLGTINSAKHEGGIEQLGRASDQWLDLIEDARIELGKALAPILQARRKKKATKR